MKGKANHGGATPRTYILVWAGLIALTAATVTVASLQVGGAAVGLALAIAAVKSTLVLLYFMHLRWEKRLLIKLAIPITLVTLAIFIGLTYTDVLRR